MAQAFLARISGPSSGFFLAPCSSVSVDGPSSSIASSASASLLTASGRRRGSSCATNAVDRAQFGGCKLGSDGKRRALFEASAVPDVHSFIGLADWVNLHASTHDLHSVPFLGNFLNLADWLNPDWFAPQLDQSKFAVKLDISPETVLDDQSSDWKPSFGQMRHFYMAAALVFSWGCCVFGSMNDEFYDSDLYRNDGGNGTNHWIYDKEERDAAEARAEMWSEELASQIEAAQIEEKSEEIVRY